jgi:hypothetical protein
LGCHGASARGGVGPNLGRSRLSFQQFLDQLRKPRKLMPTFPHAIVSNEEARSRLKRIANRGPAPLLQRLAASNPLYVGYLWRSRPTETVLSDPSAFENHSNQATDNPL